MKRYPFWSAKNLFHIHSWLGYKLSILLFFICFTGVLATISKELDWLFIDEMRVSVENNETRTIAWQAMVDKTRQRYPLSALLNINAPEYENFAATGTLIHPQRGKRRLLFNPYSGEILAEHHWYANLHRLLRDLHRYLLYPVGGIYIVGVFGFILLGLFISAFWVYKKWWLGFLKKPRNKQGLRVFYGDSHRLMGIWSLWFLSIMAVTSSWYLVEELVRNVGINIQMERPYISQQELKALTPIAPIISVNDAINITNKQLPSLEIRSISLPTLSDEPYYLSGQTDTILVRNRANHIFINPYNGSVLKKQIASEQNSLQRWIDMADPLHFGNFAGLTSKIIWLLFGLLLLVMLVFGSEIKRLREKKNRAKNSQSAKQITNQSEAVKEKINGPYHRISIALIIGGLLIGSLYIAYDSNMINRRDDIQLVKSFSIGPWSAQLFANRQQIQQANDFILDLKCGRCLTNIQQAEMVFYAGNESNQSKIQNINFRRGNRPYFDVLSLTVNNTDLIRNSNPSIVITDWNNERYEYQFNQFSNE